MAQSKKTPADHPREYRQGEQEKATKLRIGNITIDMAAGVKAEMTLPGSATASTTAENTGRNWVCT